MWLLVESIHGRPEAGRRSVDVVCDQSVPMSCLQVYRFVPVGLPLDSHCPFADAPLSKFIT
jgi:hypothetical protein